MNKVMKMIACPVMRMKIKLRSLKSGEHINEKGDGSYRRLNMV